MLCFFVILLLEYEKRIKKYNYLCFLMLYKNVIQVQNIKN